MSSHELLLENMIASGVLHSPHIIDAFYRMDRKYFVPEAYQEHMYDDIPLPIGEGQTISQPSTVAFMIELLHPQKGDKVLDIGTGSGWTTALLCTIVGEEGSVDGLERIDKLVSEGRKHISPFGFEERCTIQKASDTLGKPGEKFDKILVSASSEEMPVQLLEQLKEDGVLVIPVKNTIHRFTKEEEGYIKEEAYPGFRFVPLIYES